MNTEWSDTARQIAAKVVALGIERGWSASAIASQVLYEVTQQRDRELEANNAD